MYRVSIPCINESFVSSPHVGIAKAELLLQEKIGGVHAIQMSVEELHEHIFGDDGRVVVYTNWGAMIILERIDEAEYKKHEKSLREAQRKFINDLIITQTKEKSNVSRGNHR